MDETHLKGSVDLIRADGDSEVGLVPPPESPATSHRQVRKPVELPEPPEKLYVIRVEGPPNPSDPALAAALAEVYEEADRDPNRWHNNPEKQREALEGWRELLEEWQSENGAFTEEERARARELLYGP